ncbi:MAG TPA: class I SAM-dependent methyltransferase [Caulobacteraceae bacterium]|jgi:ubiquinone/menaquinone biosynthesis C-methylase UbiE
MTETWDDKFAYLAESRRMLHNEDYWRFLVRDVWRLTEAPVRIVDFGCGFGWGAMWLLPLLPAGSSYVGFDMSEQLVREGQAVLDHADLAAVLARGEATAAPLPSDAFDVAFAHTVLMHLPDQMAALTEMIRVTRPGGLVITCDASHNAINAMLHIHETDEQQKTPLALWQKMEATWRAAHGADGNLGMKTPVLMRQAGLVDIEARVSDAVRTSFPPIDTPEKDRTLKALLHDGLGGYPADEASFERSLAAFVRRGATQEEAVAELRRQMANDYRATLAGCHVVQPSLMTISYGRKPSTGATGNA